MLPLRVVLGLPEAQSSMLLVLAVIAVVYGWFVALSWWQLAALLFVSLKMVRYIGGGAFTSLADMRGKTVLITGGNSGIGKAAAQVLARQGARVIIACRDMVAGQKAVDEINSTVPRLGEASCLQLNVADVEDVKRFAKLFIDSGSPLDILVNNAGINLPGSARTTTPQGAELHFGTNHLGHFALTLLLLPLLNRSKGRVVNVASVMHFMPTDVKSARELNVAEGDAFNFPMVYSKTKLANVLFTLRLQKLLVENKSEVTTYSLHPGSVYTNMMTKMIGDLQNPSGRTCRPVRM
eukprot:gnl/Spiro4/26548_TR13217_c0_g1_i2.p1 gnl/Spiro4/26548_TR13217_c0_g1~~gnl/Spiro4/26548_TR13217_c0_g1_i2.p1  ORF type:complete len:306 (+),score=54.52 gnl/Spiro4/26548_TR13217_c0_g1_i2:38-919(+)